MIFKNLTLMKLVGDRSSQWDIRCDLNDAKLKEFAQPGCGTLQQCSVGFASIIEGSDDLSHESSNATLLRLSIQKRDIPASVVKAALKERIAAYRDRMQRTPGKRVRDQLKDEVMHDLLPRAFVKEQFHEAYIDWELGLLVVNTTSDRVAEMFVGQLRKVFESFPADNIATRESVDDLMTEWVISGDFPRGFASGTDADMDDPMNTRIKVNVRNHDLAAEEVVEHLQKGKRVTQLALIYDDRIKAVMDESVKLRKIKFTDVANDELVSSMGEESDKRADFDAAFAFMTLEFRQLLKALDAELGFQ